MVCEYFLPVWSFSFYPINVAEDLTLMKSSLLIFLFMHNAFDIMSKNTSPNPMCQENFHFFL